MRNSLFISIIVLLLTAAAGCGDKISGNKPELKLEDVNTHEVAKNSLLRFSFSFQSKQAADSIYIEKVVPNCPASAFDAFFKVPDYPVSVGKGNMDIFFVNGFLGEYVDLRSPLCGTNDTVTFKFVIRDVGGNSSDTITSPQIVILK